MDTNAALSNPLASNYTNSAMSNLEAAASEVQYLYRLKTYKESERPIVVHCN